MPEHTDATWSKAFIDSLPDDAFLHIDPGGEKDAEGKTTPRSKRHFPYRGKDGAVDLPHLRDAIGRIPQSDVPEKSELQAKAQKLLEGAQEKKGDGGERVQRFDLSSGKVGDRRRTPQGGLIADARPTRTGIFQYVQPDGSMRRELRHPDDVFDPESLKSLEHAPLTIDHPSAVTPHNWKDVAVGHVASTPQRDGQYVATELRIHDADAMKRADAGELQELSCGYTCNIDRTPGEYQGEPYDARQRGIRYNHVAAGPAGWGRGGPEVRMRLDSGCAVSGLPDGNFYVVPREASMADEKKTLEDAQAALTKANADLEKARSDAKDAKTEADKAAARTREAEAETGRLRAENEVLKLQASRADSANEKAQRAKAVAEEAQALREAERLGEKFLGKDFRADGKTAVEIKRAVLAHLEPELGKDNAALAPEKLDGATLEAVLSQAVRHADSVRDDRGSVQHATIPRADAAKGMPGAKGTDGDEDDKDSEIKKAQDAMVARNKDAWKTGKKWDRKRAQDAQRSK